MKFTVRDKEKAWKDVVRWAKEEHVLTITFKEGEIITAEFFPQDIEAILFIDEKLKQLKRDKRKK